MPITDEELDRLAKEHYSLLKSKDILERDGDKYFERIKEVDKEINVIKCRIDERTTQVLTDVYKKNEPKDENDGQEDKKVEQKILVEENKMADEPKVKEPKTAVEKTPKQNTLAAAIEKTLLMKSIKDLDGAVEKVATIMPDKEKRKIKNQIKNIIRAVTQGKQPRWQKYSWDETAYLLIEK